MDLVYLFRVLLRKKWVIISFSVFSAVLAFTAMMFKKDLYESVAQYSTGFTAEKVKLSDGSVAVDIYTLDIKFNNVVETFKSPRVIGMLSYKLMLHDIENPQKPFKALDKIDRSSEVYKSVSADSISRVLKSKVALNELLSPSNKVEQNILEYLKLYDYDYYGLIKKLIIRRVDRTDYLDIIYQSENPELSAFIVNTLGAEFLNYYKGLNEFRNTESAQNVQQLLSIQQQKVDSLTNELKVARVSQGALDPVEQTKNAMETVKELQLELSTAQGQYNLQSRLYDSYNERIKMLTSSLNTGGSLDAVSLFKKRDDLREQIAQASSPDVDLMRQLNQIEAQLKHQSGNGVNRGSMQTELSELYGKASEAKARMKAASTSVAQLSRLITASNAKSNVSPKTQVEIDAIGRVLEIENNELRGLREKLSQAVGLIKDNPTANFSQTLVGEPDIKPVPKHKILTTGLAGISTFVITSLVFLLMAIFDSTIKTPSQFNKQVKMPLKGVLNEVNLKKYLPDDLMLKDYSGSKFKREVLLKNNIRKLRFEVEKTGKQVFLFTSTEKGVGKTFVLQLLSFGLLLSKKKILLLDLNFENNTLSQIFNAKHSIEDVIAGYEYETYRTYSTILKSKSAGNQYVLEDVVTESSAEPYNIISSIDQTPYEGLHILGCKGGAYSPSEMNSFSSFTDLIREMKKRYDYIFIESAAANNRSDSYELFQFADRVITVFSADNVVTHTDLKSIDAINNLSEKSFGVVLNKVEFENINF